MNIHSIYGIFMRMFRPGRIRVLRDNFPQIDGTGPILDVGGAPAWWKLVQPKNRDITIVNLDDREKQTVIDHGFKFQKVDARRLPFACDAFELAFSNSVIEHVGGFEDQKRFADEILRCGRNLYLQTPNKWFPIEPHLMAPLIHLLPFSLQRHLVRWFSVWGWVMKPGQTAIDEFIRSIRLVTRKELEIMFPGCEISAERILGIPKSYIVMKRAPGTGDAPLAA